MTIYINKLKIKADVYDTFVGKSSLWHPHSKIYGICIFDNKHINLMILIQFFFVVSAKQVHILSWVPVIGQHMIWHCTPNSKNPANCCFKYTIKRHWTAVCISMYTCIVKCSYVSETEVICKTLQYQPDGYEEKWMC